MSNKEVALLNIDAIWNIFFLLFPIMESYSWIVYSKIKIVTLHDLNIKVI